MGDYGPRMGPMRENESRYVDLPTLTRCRCCDRPLRWMEEMTVVVDGKAHDRLCAFCADEWRLRGKGSRP